MRLYPRKKRNGERVWWASWTEGKITKRQSTRCSTRSAAEVVVARWERERADPVYAAAQNATFGVEAGLFLAACESAVAREKMAPETLRMYEQKAGALVRIIGKDTRLASFSAATFQDYLDRRRAEFLEDRERPIAESTLYKEWVAFRQILKRAWRAQRFGRDPASLRPEHFGAEYKPRKTFLSEEQANALLDNLTGDRKRTVAFVLATGARRREWTRAQDGDLDTEKWQVLIRGTKTKKSLRTIPILEPMRAWAKIAGQGPFPSWSNARRDLALACTAAGVPVCTWNDLRRTFASRLALAGVQSDVGRRMMGHGSTAMWDLVYAQASIGDLREMAERQIREPSVNHRPSKKAVRGTKGRR